VNAITTLVAAADPSAAEAKLVLARRRSNRLVVSLVASEGFVGCVGLRAVTVNGKDRGGVANRCGRCPAAGSGCRSRAGKIGRGAPQATASPSSCKNPCTTAVLGSPQHRAGLSDEDRGGEAFLAIEFIPGTISSGGE
jgi:hypothetical protein